MNEKKKAFAEYYIETQNATQSAAKAGYSKSSARTRGSELLNDNEVAEYISVRLSQIKCQRMATADDVLKYLSSCVLGLEKETKFFVTRSGTTGKNGSYEDVIESIEVVVSHAVRVRAAECMAKIFKLTDNFNITAEKVQIINDIPRRIN